MPRATDGGGTNGLLARAYRVAALARRPDLVMRAVAATLRVAFPGARVDVFVRRRGAAWSHDLVRPFGAMPFGLDSLAEPLPRGPLRRDLAGGEDVAGDGAARSLGLTHRLLVPRRLREVRVLLSVARSGQPFRRADLTLARLLTELVAPALAEEVRLARAQRAQERARFVQRFTASVNRSLEPDEILHLAAVRLAPRIRFDRVELALLGGRGVGARRIALEAGDGFRQASSDMVDPELIPLPSSLELAEARVDEDLSLLTEDPSAWDLLDRGCLSRIVVPLVARKRVLGTLNLARRERGSPGRDELGLLAIVTRPLAVAVDNARLHAEVRRRLKQMAALYEVAQALSSVADTAGVTERVLRILHDTFEFKHSAVLHLETDKEGVKWLSLEASRGYSQRSDADFRIRVGGRGVTSRAVLRQELIYVPDVRQDPAYVQGVEQGRSEVAVPLEVSGRIIGVLDVESTEVAAFSDEDLETLKLFATQVGLALERARLFEEIRRQAMTDSLTGLLNQRYFQQAVAREIERSRRTGRPFVVALIDIDDFKRINDEHGHVAGNDVIVAISRALEGRLRSIDAAARFGGDEFAAVLSETDATGGMSFLSDVRLDVQAAIAAGGLPAFTLSAGLAAWRPELRGVEDIVSSADEALYRAKSEGKDRACLDASGSVT